jgi:DNA processing protein
LPATKAGFRSEKAESALKRRELDPQERLDWLRLARTETVGPVTFHAMLRRFGSARAALAALPRLARKSAAGRAVSAPEQAEIETEMAALARLGARLLCWGEPAYPAALAAIEDAPPVLTLFGRAELLDRPMVAVIGARNASANGCRLARELASGLGKAGLVVVSGLARGIDAAAHLGALETGTTAVVAGGVDIVYPEQNRGLYEALAEQGAILSELPLGSEPQARHFPRRNRIISGLALGVVVVEAAARSGSLITARFALEQGREVFAVPGSPLDPRCRGTNDLLRNGATLTETAEDVLTQLGPLVAAKPPPSSSGPAGPPAAPAAAPTPRDLRSRGDPDIEAGLALIVEKLGPTPVPVDELVRQCHLSAAAVATLLLELELAGRVERHPGNLVSLR